MKREFTVDSCFPVEVPVNAAEIVAFLNEEAVRRGVHSYDFEDDTGAYVMDQIWEDYCNGKMGPKWVFEQEYVVEFAVNGRAYVDARGCSPAEAARAAKGDFGDVDLRLAKSPAAPGCSLHAPAGAVGELYCVDYKVAIAYNDNNEIFEGNDVETGCSDIDGEQDYTVGFEVDGRASVSVKAVDTVEAVQKACRKVGELDFGGLECIVWKVVKVTDAKGKMYDDERDLFGAAQAGVDRLIAGAERQRSGVNKGHGVRSAEDPERV